MVNLRCYARESNFATVAKRRRFAAADEKIFDWDDLVVFFPNEIALKFHLKRVAAESLVFRSYETNPLCDSPL